MSKIEHAQTHLLRRSFGSEFDHITRLALVTSDVNHVTIDKHVTVIDKLACCLTSVAKAEAIANIVETQFKELKNDFTRDTTTASSFLIVAAELSFQNAVLETEFLLFAESYGVLAFFLTTSFDAVLTGWKIAALQ